MKANRFLALAAAIATAASLWAAPRTVVAYVTGGSDVMPDPTIMTHINYAFGHVTPTFDGVRIDNPERLQNIVALKKDNPNLKVLLSVGGWGSGNFSEMAKDSQLRAAFVADCLKKADEIGLDGIDIDWEYPTSSAAGISSDPSDTDNFTELMKELRAALGNDRLVTLATICTAKYIDFPAILPYIDFVNVMSYDMGPWPKLHNSIYRSERSGYCTLDEAYKAHLEAGVPADRMTLGVPLYGRGGDLCPDYVDYKDLDKQPFEQQWDDVAKAPYFADSEGNVVLTFETPESMALKLDYIKETPTLGAMYWEYSCDKADAGMCRMIWNALNPGQ